jgi:hypothetical protein
VRDVYVFRVEGSTNEQFIRAVDAEAAMNAAIEVAGTYERVQKFRRATNAEESEILAEWEDSK